ncbi:DUF5008 domain-containing protein [Chitinophaga lutea]
MKQIISKHTAGVLLLAALAAGCNKQEKEYPNPYQGGKEQLGISFSQELPSPQNGGVGDVVTFKATGLLPHKDALEFLMNGQKAQVMAVTDKSISVKVPAGASSGGSLLVVGEQLFPVPVFRVNGKVSIDRTYQAGKGTNGLTTAVVPTIRGRYLVMGAFTEYANVGMSDPLYGLVLTEKHGQYVAAFRTDSAVGRNGVLYTGVQLPDGKFILGGSFGQYGKETGVFNLTRIHEGGKLDSTIVRVIPRIPPGMDPHDPEAEAAVDNSSRDTVPTFNGGFLGTVRKVLLQGNKLICIGDLGLYQQYFYENSTRDNRAIDRRWVGDVVRLDTDGNLDSTYHYDLVNHRGLEGPAGSLTDGVVLPDGKLIVVGAFRTYNGAIAGNIARLTAAGSVDPSFAAGAGADDAVTSMHYSAATKKIVITGRFKNYNGRPRPGIAMINEDGSLDETFAPGTFTDGTPGYSGQLSSGLVVVTGTFRKYNNVTREGFMVLNPDGSLAEGYNNTGRLNGFITSMVESVTAEGEPAIILSGLILSFDNTSLGGILRVVLSK